MACSQLFQLLEHGLRVDVAWIELDCARVRFDGIVAAASRGQGLAETVEDVRGLGKLLRVELEDPDRAGGVAPAEQRITDTVKLGLGEIVTVRFGGLQL